MKDGEYNLFLSHFPMIEWDGFYKNRYLFYGHVHYNDRVTNTIMKLLPNAINVGVDVNDFMPKTAEELIKERIWQPPTREEMEILLSAAPKIHEGNENYIKMPSEYFKKMKDSHS